MTQQARTPTTEAGRTLLERESLNSRSFALITPDAVADIEDEARADLLTQIEKAVLAMHDWRPVEGGTLGRGAQWCAFSGCDDAPERHATRANVLAAIRAAAPVEPG